MPRCMPAQCLVMFVAALGACAKEVPIVEVQGECADVFQGQACAWARMQGNTVVDVGATVPLSSIENAPKDAEMAWPPAPTATLTLPEAAQPQTGLTHITVYWEPIGHPPAPFLVPHFDFHFYTISSGERLAVDCADTSKPPALPSGYSLPDMTLPPDRAKMVGVSTLVGICVPQMGMHSLPTTQLESTTPFRGTMIIGYYHGKPIFVEPMLSQAMLMEKADFNLPIPFVAGMAGNYPRAFRAEYDDQQRVYRFVFADFTAGT